MPPDIHLQQVVLVTVGYVFLHVGDKALNAIVILFPGRGICVVIHEIALGVIIVVPVRWRFAGFINFFRASAGNIPVFFWRALPYICSGP